jgi:hypothetical protein
MATFCLYPENLCESEFKSDNLISLVEEISGQPSIQAVAWLLLANFVKIYSRNGTKSEQKDLKNMHFSQKRSIFKVGTKKVMVVK